MQRKTGQSRSTARWLTAVSLALTALFATSAATQAVQPAPRPSQAHYEVRFMTGMIDHHHMAIMMSEVAVEKSVHEELRQMAEDIIAAQSAEIEMLQTWLQDWYGVTYEPQMKPGMMKEMERLAALPPEEFEIAYMKGMIKHHMMAVKEGEKCVRKAYHADLIAMCHDIIETQMAEIQQLETWLCEWYGICQ